MEQQNESKINTKWCSKVFLMVGNSNARVLAIFCVLWVWQPLSPCRPKMRAINSNWWSDRQKCTHTYVIKMKNFCRRFDDDISFNSLSLSLLSSLSVSLDSRISNVCRIKRFHRLDVVWPIGYWDIVSAVVVVILVACYCRYTYSVKKRALNLQWKRTKCSVFFLCNMPSTLPFFIWSTQFECC